MNDTWSFTVHYLHFVYVWNILESLIFIDVRR